MAQTYVNTRRFMAPLATATGKVQWLGVAMFGTILTLAVFAPLFTAYAPQASSCGPFETPSAAHWIGCDDAGHDLWSQLLHGGRVSLLVGLSAAGVSTLVAVLVAIVAGFYGGWVDRVVMRGVDVILALPFLPLVIVLGIFLGASIQTQVLVIALVMWAQPVRELRAQILTIRASGFVEASLAMGASGRFVGLRHILPEMAPLIVPQFVRIAHTAIIVETSLSFLGLGDPLQTSWGTILLHANARAAFLTGAWTYWIMPPGLAISLTVLSLAFIGFGYDASLAPRIRRRRAVPPLRPVGAAPEPGAVLTARGLRVVYDSETGSTEAVRGVDMVLRKGELVGLVGESGSGKTSMSLAILQLLRHPARLTAGAVWLGDEDLTAMGPEALRALRGRRIALVPQSAMNALNPVLTIGAQMEEALARGARLTWAERRARVVEWLVRVGLKPAHAASYPHELSGGMRQRAVIAIALCNTPDVVIADEPTTGLDVLVQEEIMALLLSLRQSLDLSILFVTHNLPLIARHADRLAVMYRGEIVDEGTPRALMDAARHAHTKGLFADLPQIGGDKRWTASDQDDLGARAPVLALERVSKTFRAEGVLGLGRGAPHRVLDEVSLLLRPGEKLGLVGASGAGKSTLARIVMGMTGVDAGRVLFNGEDLSGLGAAGRARLARDVHMVFQDPYQSLRNGMSIRDVVAEPLRIRGLRDTVEIEARVRAALAEVQLPDDGAFLSRRPVQLSGGQRQRVAFARAIVSAPQVIIADEPTSMLDQSIRMGVMDLMERLRQRHGTAFLFITHDIALARHFCDRLMVLDRGRIVEEGPADDVAHRPTQAFTRRLIAAA